MKSLKDKGHREGEQRNGEKSNKRKRRDQRRLRRELPLYPSVCPAPGNPNTGK